MRVDEFKAVVQPLADKLYRIALRRMENREDAQDAVQEILLRMWNLVREGKDIANLEAFAVRSTIHLCMDMLKKKGRNNVMLDEAGHLSVVEDDPARSLSIKDEVVRLKRLIKSLPPLQQQILELRDMEGYSHEEIAEILGIDINQSKVYLHRARKSLKQFMNKKVLHE